eukprot:TRINITY_DN5718_c0_g1_i3.p1 TRINITY_DN5718_c0_g1~~TRINITY_DN5718_c0_g1_i3.p1  ORF type:complete len:363 (+),score=70.82 TRINITY_DN5718_c0_g1_i3:99-1187(+)
MDAVPATRTAGLVMMSGLLLLSLLFGLLSEPRLPRTRLLADDSAVRNTPDAKAWDAMARNHPDDAAVQAALDWRARHDGDACCGSLSASCSSFQRCSDISWPALIGCMLLISVTGFGFTTYSTRINFLLDIPDVFTRAQKAEFVFGILGGITVTVIASLWLIRWVSDRLLLVIAALVLLAGYLTVLNYPGVALTGARFVIGSALITLSDNFVMAIGSSLFSKLVPQQLIGLWMGILQAVVFVGKVASALLLNAATADGPYYATLGGVGLALLLLIPFFRELIPQLHSPWSGAGLPVTNSAVSEEFPDEISSLDGSRAALIGSQGTGSRGTIPSYGADPYVSMPSHVTLNSAYGSSNRYNSLD